jgi:hypothetical protein
MRDDDDEAGVRGAVEVDEWDVKDVGEARDDDEPAWV